ncbi:MAG: O-antigen ligase family protein [Candidatus Fervidibacter sp.]|uniref:O-antigen ligase family protein n=1 Tax=Candidatus Fervidibacter sp. TaxID=3100871 RepID=UPI004048EDCA
MRPMPFPEWMVYGIAILGGLLTWRDVRFGLVAVAISIGISSEIRTDLAKDLRLEDFVIAAVVMAWLLRKVANNERVIPETPLNRLWGLWLFAGGLSVILGVAFGTVTSVKVSVFHWLKRLELLLLFWVVADSVRSLGDVRLLATSGMVGALLSSFIGWHQKWINPPREDVHWNAYKVGGPTGEKSNVYAQYLVFNILVGLALGFSLYLSPASWAILAIAWFTLVPVLFSFSRSGMAALGLGTVALVGVFHRRWLLVLLVCYFLLPVLIPSVVQRRFQELSWERFKIERLGGYIASVRETFNTNPLTGRGLGFAGFNRYENQYANTLAHEGILGLVAFLALLWSVMKMHREAMELTDEPYLKGILQGCYAGTIAFLIAGLSGVPLLAIRPAETFWFWTGLSAGIWRLALTQAFEGELIAQEVSEMEVLSTSSSRFQTSDSYY